MRGMKGEYCLLSKQGHGAVSGSQPRVRLLFFGWVCCKRIPIRQWQTIKSDTTNGGAIRCVQFLGYEFFVYHMIVFLGEGSERFSAWKQGMSRSFPPGSGGRV